MHKLNLTLIITVAAISSFAFYSMHAEQAQTTQSLENVLTDLRIQTAQLSNAVMNLEQIVADTTELTETQLEQLSRGVEADIASLSVQTAEQIAEVAEPSITALIAEWSPAVYRIECEVDLPDGEHKSSGSAVVERFDGSVHFITNAHVVTEDDVLASSCKLVRRDSEDDAVLPMHTVTLAEDDDIAEGLVVSTLPGIRSAKRCTTAPQIGDSILILGYPAIGAQESITATEGIIAGLDEERYLTTAKIDSGASGGAAIHVENNCLIGLPTTAVRGAIESLARILPL